MKSIVFRVFAQAPLKDVSKGPLLMAWLFLIASCDAITFSGDSSKGKKVSRSSDSGLTESGSPDEAELSGSDEIGDEEEGGEGEGQGRKDSENPEEEEVEIGKDDSEVKKEDDSLEDDAGSNDNATDEEEAEGEMDDDLAAHEGNKDINPTSTTGKPGPDDQFVKQCIDKLGRDHPFDATTQYRVIDKAITGSSTHSRVDSIKTKKPELVLVKVRVVGSGKIKLSLTNPKAYYCLKAYLLGSGQIDIKHHVDASVIDSDEGSVGSGSINIDIL